MNNSNTETFIQEDDNQTAIWRISSRTSEMLIQMILKIY